MSLEEFIGIFWCIFVSTVLFKRDRRIQLFNFIIFPAASVQCFINKTVFIMHINQFIKYDNINCVQITIKTINLLLNIYPLPVAYNIYQKLQYSYKPQLLPCVSSSQNCKTLQLQKVESSDLLSFVRIIIQQINDLKSYLKYNNLALVRTIKSNIK